MRDHLHKFLRDLRNFSVVHQTHADRERSRGLRRESAGETHGRVRAGAPDPRKRRELRGNAGAAQKRPQRDRPGQNRLFGHAERRSFGKGCGEQHNGVRRRYLRT